MGLPLESDLLPYSLCIHAVLLQTGVDMAYAPVCYGWSAVVCDVHVMG
jgi:hypothetical protein